MKVLQVHCRYKSGLGGEDSVVEEESWLLRHHGVVVSQFFGDNLALANAPAWRRPIDAAQTVWNPSQARAISAHLREFRPDVVHIHNLFAALSPSVIWAAKSAGVPVVMSLHNYRLLCATAILLRDNQPCETCVGRLPLPALRHGCRYNDSLAIGLSIVANQAVHSLLGTFTRTVSAFVALTDFQRDLFIRAGIPARRIHVKPNFIKDVQPDGPENRARTILFAGKVSLEKGTDLLTSAWSGMAHEGHLLVIAGDGPLSPELCRTCTAGSVEWLGWVPREKFLDQLRRARWLVLPSRWYEGFPMVLVEALAHGVPVIVPDHGGFPGMAPDGACLRFRSSDQADLADQLRRAVALSDTEWRGFSSAARATYAARYTPEANYARLVEIYEAAIAEAA